MNEPMMQVIREMTVRVHTLKQAQAAELAGAARHRQAGDYTRAAIAEHAAQVNADMAVIYQEVAGILSGTWLPEAADVTEPGEGLGVRVGVISWAPPAGATPGQLHQWREFCDELQQTGIRQKYLTDDAIPGAHATQATGQLAPEDMPQPDPLTAAPAEETRTPSPQEEGDATPVPYAHLLGKRVVVRLTGQRRAHGVLRGAGRYRLVLEPHEDGPGPVIPARDVDAVHELAGRADAGIYERTPDGGVRNVLAQLEESRAYPDTPVNGGPVEQAQERGDDPSALSLDGEVTQAFPAPVVEDGDQQ